MGLAPSLRATSTTYVEKCVIEGARGLPRECDTPRVHVHLAPNQAITLLAYFVATAALCLALYAAVWYLTQKRP